MAWHVNSALGVQVIHLVYATVVLAHARVRVGVKRGVGELHVHATHGRRKVAEETNATRPVVMLTYYDGRVHLAALAMIRQIHARG